MKLRTGIWIGVGVAAAALISLPFLLPLDTYRAPIERAASAALGREVKIRGPLHLAVYPQIGISLTDVSIANPPGSQVPEMVSIGSVLVGAELMPLLSRRLEITEVVLEKPVIHLEKNKDGTPNWRFQAQGAPGQTQAQPRPANAPAPAQNNASGFDFRTVSIKDGEVTYFDAASNDTEAFHDIAIKLTLQPGPNRQLPMNAPLKVDGQLTYNSEPLKIDAKIDRFGPMLNGQATQLHVGISSNVINADFEGTLGSEGQLMGALKMGAHSVRSFAAWMGHPMPPGNGFGLMALEGQLRAQDGVYTLGKSHLAFDSMNISPDLSIDTNKDVLALSGVLRIDRLDVNPYLAPGKETDSVKAGKAKAKADKNDPLELGWLKAANAEVKLVLGGLVTPDLKLDQAIVDVNLKDGVLKADLTNVTAYGGSGKGTFTLDTSGPVPALHETFDVKGLKAQAFLDDVIGVKEISGTAEVKVDLTARGASEAAILKSLNGKGAMKFSNGTITGADLAAVGRALQSVLTAEVLTGAVGENAKTPFGQMSATVTVQNGVVTTNDLMLDSQAVELSGKGSADLNTHQLDFHLEPKAKKGIPGLKLVDIGVPFNIKGPWEHPSYTPDAGGIVKGVAQKLGQGAALPIDIVKDPGGALKSLFGGKGK